MKRVLMSLLLPAMIVFAGCTADKAGTAGKAVIKVGVGETVITPAENMRMAGFARSQVSTGIHDDLHARSLVIESADGKGVVLMTVAIVGMSDPFAKRIREGITAKTQIPGENIVISCTHTHAGPSAGRSSDPESDSSNAQKYSDFLVDRCIESAVKAWETRVPGRIGIASAEVFELGRNRRYLQYGGVHPDPEVAVIKIEDARGKLLGVAFNYGCHPSGLDWSNTLFSEDWPYFAIQGIKKEVGEQVWVAYYQSAEGNINVGYTAELSAVGAEMPVRSYWYIEKKGNQMAEAVLKALPGITTAGDPVIETSLDRFDYPLRESYPISLEQAERDAKAAQVKLAALEKLPEFQGTRTLDKARVEVFSTNQRFGAARRFYGNKERPATRSLEQQAVRIGDAVFVTFPGELFSDIGLKIKKGSLFEKTFVIGVTPGPGGYLPSADQFIDGDYEIDGSSYSPKTEEFCIVSSLNLIERVTKQAGAEVSK
ncbi:MAG: neutral/alkaline non-lysosomal ceramidase N-terminal domain-containing protein [Candidatus Latescibacterota bacterium]